ncbi:MAG: anthranilate phosphoribosyltransferase [Desulfobacterales bacterium]|nr:anthranilate phosphoribosyltransferase [Desulfobacterales bacterium]
MFKEYLNKIVKRHNLADKEIEEMIMQIFSGNIVDTQIAAFMAALATKGETFEELAGAAKAMRRKAVRIQASASTVVDTCGTGGDGAQTFNISTTTAFVVAGCGVTVAKHGNRSISSKCGSADLLEALGIKIDTAPEIVEESIREIGIGFLFAPIYHGAMKYAAKPRKEVGIRSIFNMLGPLTNPAGANCQLLGVYAPELTEMFASALKLLGTKRAFVVHGHDGLDEISVCDATRISELKDGFIRTYDLSPEQFFGERAKPGDLIGGTSSDNAEITKRILKGEKGPKLDVVLINSAAALIAAGIAKNFDEGIKLAAESIEAGKAYDKLEKLIRFTQDNG